MHKLLERLMRRNGVAAESLPANVRALMEAVSQCFDQSDSDRVLLERSMDLASAELTHANESLKSELEHRSKAEFAIKQTMSLLQSTLESTGDGILVVDQNWRVVLYNQRFARMWDIPVELLATADSRESLGRALELVEDPKAFRDRVRDITSRPTEDAVDVLELKDGRVIERTSIPQILDGRPVGRVWSFRDITSRRNAEESVARLSQFSLDRAMEAAYWLDERGKFFYANDVACRLLEFDRSELLQHSLGDVDASGDGWTQVWERAKRTGSFTLETSYRRRSGAMLPVEASVHYVEYRGREYLCVFFFDITRRKELERQVLQAQKMDAVGRLAGGIAHDFNNLLTVINGYSDFLMGSVGPNDPRLGDVQQIKNAGLRAAGLTRQLLAFSRKQVMQPRRVEIDPLVQTFKQLLQRLLSEDIEFTSTLQAGDATVLADPGQLEQVIMNLVLNARDAMPNGGRLNISTSSAPDGQVVIEVSDSGCGMDPEVQSHLFEPFFTTKEPGKGTGLGLSTAYGIIQQTGGTIQVISARGQGSTFRILLPRCTPSDEPVDAAPASEASSSQGTVLLAEDEDALRGLVRSILEARGYRVIEARNGAEALDRCVRERGTIDAVLTDVVMPGMTGIDFVERLRKLKPQIRVVYMSGHTDHAGIVAILQSGALFVQKPFSAETLTSKLADALAAV